MAGNHCNNLTSENMTRVRHNQAQGSTTEQMSMEMTKHYAQGERERETENTEAEEESSLREA